MTETLRETAARAFARTGVGARLAGVLMAVCMLACGPAAQAQRQRPPADAAAIVLTGADLTPADVRRIADAHAFVRIAPEARGRVAAGHAIVLAAARDGQKIYGLTTGVGLRKTETALTVDGDLTRALVESSTRFNRNLLRAHSAGLAPELDATRVRAMMAVRLNGLLSGGAGVQPRVVELYAAFLNEGMTPVVPGGGSVGQADITVAAHIGLAMMGEGEAYYDGARMPAAEALAAADLEPLTPFAKDALSILSSNALSSARATLSVDALVRLEAVAHAVFALSLEAFNGNTAPFSEAVVEIRPFAEMADTAEDLRRRWAGGAITEPDPARRLQDPLSFRTGVYQFATIQKARRDFEAVIATQINHGDDNPSVVFDPKPAPPGVAVVRTPDGVTGAVTPTAAFDPLALAHATESVKLALGYASLATAQRCLRLFDADHTGLPAYLGDWPQSHAFGAAGKPIASLAMQARGLAAPRVLDYVALSGGVEDVSTQAPAALADLQAMIDVYAQLVGMELLVASQAADLRLRQTPDFRFSPAARELHAAFRAHIPVMTEDRVLAADFEAAHAFITRCVDAPDAAERAPWCVTALDPA